MHVCMDVYMASRDEILLQQASIEPEWLNNYLYVRATEMASARDPMVGFS